MKKAFITTDNIDGFTINQNAWDETKKNHPGKEPSAFVKKLLICKGITP